MGVVRGAISIRDNMSAVLRSVRQEQSAFRRDVERTRRELQATWERRRTARLDATPANRAAQQLRQRLEPLRKKIVIAAAIKDMVSDKIRAVGNKVKAVGKMIATPIVKLKDGVTAGLSKIKSQITGLAKTVAIPVTLAATVVMGGAISQGAALEQSIGGVETLFKQDAGVVKANADAAFRTAGLSANAYMEQVTSFSASLISSLSGDTAKAATVADMALIDMADNANKFGTDMESIQSAYQGFAKQNYTMLDNLKLGYGGTKEEMQRLLSDAQKLTGIKYDIDNLADVYNAIHAVQENLGVTGTTAKEASETFSGSFSAMKAAAQNLMGNMAIGGDVTSSMKELVSTASTFLMDNAIPMVGRVITSLPEAIQTGIQIAAPKIKSLGAAIVQSLRDGIVSFLPSGMGGLVDDLFSAIGDFKSGFAAMRPQFASFGASVKTTLQQVSVAVMPAVTSIIHTVQAVIPTVLPVIQTVVSTIGQVISAAAPVISGLVQGIGTVISNLAPVFQTIFDGIGQKVGSVLEFVGGKMGWIQEIIGTAAPVVADILTTAWSVISPVLDIAVSVFKVLFNVVQTVFTGIANVVGSVWDKVKPIVEGIGNGLSWIADKIGGLFGFGGDGGGEVGSNAGGTNNWRGGPTWVGERGPELVELPKGSRVLPNKESVQVAKNAARPAVQGIIQNKTEKTVMYAAGGNFAPALDNIEKHLGAISDLLSQGLGTGNGSVLPYTPPDGEGGDIPPVRAGVPDRSMEEPPQKNIQITVDKLADQIIVREEADIDRIASAISKKLAEVARNMRPEPVRP